MSIVREMRNIVFQLALMCKNMECTCCPLATKDKKCKLRHMTLMNVAKGYFENDDEEDTLVIKFMHEGEYEINEAQLRKMLRNTGPYAVKVHLDLTNVSCLLNLRADDYIFHELQGIYGADRVELRIPSQKGL